MFKGTPAVPVNLTLQATFFYGMGKRTTAQ
jgi:hypothetical protein